jgi:hypothetical protein
MTFSLEDTTGVKYHYGVVRYEYFVLYPRHLELNPEMLYLFLVMYEKDINMKKTSASYQLDSCVTLPRCCSSRKCRGAHQASYLADTGVLLRGYIERSVTFAIYFSLARTLILSAVILLFSLCLTE